MNIHSTSRVAKAVGIITWSMDTVIRFSKRHITNAIHYMQDKPLYDVDIVINGEIHKEYKGITSSKISTIVKSLELIKADIMVRRTNG